MGFPDGFAKFVLAKADQSIVQLFYELLALTLVVFVPQALFELQNFLCLGNQVLLALTNLGKNRSWVFWCYFYHVKTVVHHEKRCLKEKRHAVTEHF